MKISEVELAKPVVEWLNDQHWNVYQEVEFSGHSGVADIVAERQGILWIIECKTTYSFAVLNQAMRWPAHYRSVAVPRQLRGDNRDYRVAEDYYHVGVIEVELEFGPQVKERLLPKLFIRHNSRNHAVKHLIGQLTDLHKTYAAAGARSGNHLTEYKRSMMQIRKMIEEQPGCTVQNIYEQLGKLHYSNKSSFKGNVLSCLTTFESEWCSVDKDAKPYRLYVRNSI